MLRYEVTEEPTSGVDGERYSVTSRRSGLFRTATSANGDIVVGEDRLRALLATAGARPRLVHGLDALLGTAWDRELEPYRQSAEGGPVTSYTAVV